MSIGFKREVMEVAPWIIGVYVAICIGGYFGYRVFMYFPDPYRYTPADAGLTGVAEIELKTPDGETLVAWHAPAKPGKETLLYFHGNAGGAAGRGPKIDIMRGQGLGVFYLNNRGYGGSSGKPTEKHNVDDAILAYDHLVSLGIAAGSIVPYGESLGSGQAVRLAASRSVKAIILEAPLTSTIDVAWRTYFWLPLKLIITDRYANEQNIPAVVAPVLVLHGERDRVIPVEMGKRVYEAANDPKRLELFPEGGHSDLLDHGAWDKVEAFLASLKG